jgi:SAM-dependent methyltransferase
MRVDDERWQQAQKWELDFWNAQQQRHSWKRVAFPLLRPLLAMARPRAVTGDDWNEWWCRQFDGYAFLPRALGDYIELGCGPYTNTRLVLEGRTAARVVCSDPLAPEYVGFKGRWLAQAAARGDVEIDAHPIEECPFPAGSFDVVVMINVLDHVRDAELCLRTAIQLLRPGGWLIFGQNLANPAQAGAQTWFDQGHPIRLTLTDVEPWLDGLQPVIHRVLPANDPPLHEGVLTFAGTRP